VVKQGKASAFSLKPTRHAQGAVKTSLSQRQSAIACDSKISVITEHELQLVKRENVKVLAGREKRKTYAQVTDGWGPPLRSSKPPVWSTTSTTFKSPTKSSPNVHMEPPVSSPPLASRRKEVSLDGETLIFGQQHWVHCRL